MSLFKNAAIFRISSSSDSDNDIAETGKKPRSAGPQNSESFDYKKKFSDSCDEIESEIGKGKSYVLKQNEAGPSKVNCNKRLNSTTQRLPVHVMSDSEGSDESITCLDVAAKLPLPNVCIPSQSITKNDNIHSAIYTTDETDNPILPLVSSKTGNIGDELRIYKKRRTGLKTRVQGTDKSEKALERLKERERKQQEKILAKALKDIEKEAKRAAKPEECIKSMRLAIDEQLTGALDSEILINTLLDSGLSCSLEKNHVPSSIIWYRRVSDVNLVDNQLQRNERDELEHLLLLCIPLPLCVDLIYASIQKRKGKMAEQSFLEYINGIKTRFPKMDITIVTIGLQSFLKDRRGNIKQANEGSESGRFNVKHISKKDVDEVVIEAQLQIFLNYKPLENCVEFGQLLAKYTKAIAEAPFKKEKYQQQQQFSWYAQADGSCPVKISKNGEGYSALWQQQMQQFNLVGKDISQAIAAKYPSPLLLMEAYAKRSSDKEGEKLLEDIVVRRDYGPLGTTRRVGPELSYKMFRFFTSVDENEFLQR